MYLFGFGSLINLSSAQKSFKRVLSQNDLIPIRIKGYKRIWNAIESIAFQEEMVNGVFLNIQKDKNSVLNGVAIEITLEELEVLKLREKNYSCITIKKDEILDNTIDSDLIAFMTTNKEKIAKIGDKNSFIPAKYIDIVKNALENYDNDFKKDFESTFQDYPFPLKEGIYTFTDPIQNKAAREGTKNYNESN